MAQTYLNKKQELFCKFLAQGSTQLEAYELAGYQPSSANACTLAKHPLVLERTEELRKQFEARENEFKVLALQAQRAENEGVEGAVARNAAWTYQRIMDMMAENVRLAQIAGEYKAANETLKMMAEATKLFDTASSKKNDKDSPSNPMTLIGHVTNILDGSGDAAGNALAPRQIKAAG